ncbi:uncharacterized protein RHOBADRAFT_52395 [Rhodotorula graminis WP1]|uniref:Uncharacterized protein n=1 Tax=Rhodotorula graminis (strain WP1) TaxID=578459 RepID=A0A194S755_RHOGW|nr:uncharacterized protein RHOBADRAFT_52395 [Rhodotorula graminis WP1]KPV76379.1 hypothetical protein RHOBADRAFT_52395 [Rhodotorula graminis WP1]
MDSPDTSLYVPLSLQDTLTKPRTYTSRPAAASAAAAASSSAPSTSSSRPRPSHAHSASLSRERGELARRDAQAMMHALGMGTPAPAQRTLEVDETPRPTRSINLAPSSSSPASTQNADVAALRRQLDDKDQELAAVRREKRDLASRVSALECEAAKAAALDPRQLEELERQFEAQETLLGGYQREAERAAGELDKLRRQQRRLTDYLERTYGPAWADDLGLSDAPGRGVAAASPAVRTKLVARASLMHTPTSSSASSGAGLGSLTRSATLGAVAIPESAEDEDDDEGAREEDTNGGTSSVDDAMKPSSPHVSSSAAAPLAPGPSPALLAQHLDTVQALLRSMEARLVARDAELVATERRARSEAAKLGERGDELERLVEGQRASGAV